MDERETENIHEGHRKRLRELYLRNGVDGMQEHQVLELLLFYAIPRKDVNPLAHKLIRRFGSLGGVLNAELRELLEAGLSQNAATYIHLINDIMLYPRRSAVTQRYIKSVDDAIDFCYSLLGKRKFECMGVICLNSAGRVLHYEISDYGISDRVAYSPRRIVDAAIAHGAHSVIVTHNHPSGNPEPSQEDLMLTIALKELLHNISMVLIEHVIVAYPECKALMHDHRKNIAGDAVCGRDDSEDDSKKQAADPA